MNLRVCQGSNQCISFSCINSSICDNVHLTVCFQRAFFLRNIMLFFFYRRKNSVRGRGLKGPCYKKCVKFSVIIFKKCLFSHFEISLTANLGKSNIFKKSSVAKQNGHSLIMFGSFDPNFFANGS